MNAETRAANTSVHNTQDAAMERWWGMEESEREHWDVTSHVVTNDRTWAVVVWVCGPK